MARGRQKAEWERASWLMCILWNTHATKPRRPDEFNPFAEKRRQTGGIPITAQNIGLLKALVPRRRLNRRRKPEVPQP